MTPIEYEKIVNDILGGNLDIDVLTKLVKEETERREQEKKEKERQQEIEDRRDDFITAAQFYISAICNDEEVDEYIFSDKCFDAFENDLKTLETALSQIPAAAQKYTSNEVEDKIKEFLKKKNRPEIQF